MERSNWVICFPCYCDECFFYVEEILYVTVIPFWTVIFLWSRRLVPTRKWCVQSTEFCLLILAVSFLGITHSMVSPQIREHFPALKSELKHKLPRREKGAAMLLQVSVSRPIFSCSCIKQGGICTLIFSCRNLGLSWYYDLPYLLIVIILSMTLYPWYDEISMKENSI